MILCLSDKHLAIEIRLQLYLIFEFVFSYILFFNLSSAIFYFLNRLQLYFIFWFVLSYILFFNLSSAIFYFPIRLQQYYIFLIYQDGKVCNKVSFGLSSVSTINTQEDGALVRRVMAGMRRRMQLCVDRNGGHTQGH